MSYGLFRSALGGLFCVVATIAVLPAADAQQKPAQQESAPPTARDVLPLVTEEVTLEQGQSPTVRYWWVQPGSPTWTESDKRVRQSLATKGVDLVDLSADVRISKIYRRPSLSASNAATLGSLVGAKRVLVGTISYTRKQGVGPLGLAHVSATADVSLVSAESGESAALSRFTVERAGFAQSADEALEQVRQQTTDALSSMIANSLMRGPGPVGVYSDEMFIGLRSPQNALVLQKVTTFLEGLEQISAVQVRWSSEGVVALEVNPGKVDTQDVVEYAIRALANQSFEEFVLARRAHPSAEGIAEFSVTQSQKGDSF
jgi:hypothetical protein